MLSDVIVAFFFSSRNFKVAELTFDFNSSSLDDFPVGTFSQNAPSLNKIK